MTNKIELYHYTRANRQSIEQQGVLIRTKEQSRQDFINQFKSDLSCQVIEFLNNAWSLEHDDLDLESCNSVWFVSKRPKEGCGGIFPLVSMYGGEVISMVGESCEESKVFLESIGEPLEIVCSIPLDDPALVDLGNTELYLKRPVLPFEITAINILSCEPDTYDWKYKEVGY